MTDKSYLGDGVYAEFDGWGIWLKANVPTTDRIYLEPEVLRALINFYDNQFETNDAERDDK
jgi:hypothetical protein